MKKTIVALSVVMLTVPAWAGVAITVTDLDDGMAGIDYSGTDLVRAFALDITVDAGTIDAISDFAVGDDNNGYGIFPASFSRNIVVDPVTGDVSDWAVAGYSPVADAGDPGALGGLGTNGVTIEMGSLYDTKAPPLSGRLCVITCSEPCKVTVTTNATRGNVVLEDASEAVVDLAGATEIQIAGVGGYTGPQPEEWRAVGQPDCWLSSLNPRQCHGDADGTSQGKNKFWVSTNDLDVLIASWNKTFAELDGQMVGGIPLICGDFDHVAQGKQEFRVSTNDLDILIANWQTADAPAPDCP
ncbi:MAG: hypothetical protein H8E73_01120 [Planctomycetes bacterium]|nr:hypothetical protein [Planctomycetota bacterium]MBL7187635.1 hypothetical protein [Phycisphaerae bacterium]